MRGHVCALWAAHGGGPSLWQRFVVGSVLAPYASGSAEAILRPTRVGCGMSPNGCRVLAVVGTRTHDPPLRAQVPGSLSHTAAFFSHAFASRAVTTRTTSPRRVTTTKRRRPALVAPITARLSSPATLYAGVPRRRGSTNASSTSSGLRPCSAMCMLLCSSHSNTASSLFYYHSIYYGSMPNRAHLSGCWPMASINAAQ